MSELLLRVARIDAEAKDVVRVHLADPSGGLLPAFEPGAHLAVQLPEGLVRHYSLSNDWRERHRYVLGVGRALDGRGGSAFIHGGLCEGTDLQCSRPVNNFRLEPDASDYLFIAGGTGITPLLAMVCWCVVHRKPWRLVYGARSRQRLAFYEELAAYGDRVRFHCDDEAGAPIQLAHLLADARPGTEVYCCGPSALMAAVQVMGRHLPADALHFESFTAPAAQSVSPTPAAMRNGPAGKWGSLLRTIGYSAVG